MVTLTYNYFKFITMKNLITLFVLLSFCFGSAMAQDKTATSATKTVTNKETLIKAEPTHAVTTQDAAVERKMKTAQRLDKSYERPVVEMTDEYIHNQIAEIQKVIDKNEGNEEFNLAGYQKRIKYLESRRPKK